MKSFCLLFLCQAPLFANHHEITALTDYRTITPSSHFCMPTEIIGNSEMASTYLIPKKIMQTWKTHELPDLFAKWSSTWNVFHPTWDYILMDDHDNRAYIEKYFPWFLSIYDSFPQEIYRADAIRYFYLYNEGGVYADLDFECLKPLDPLIAKGGVILGKMTDAPIDGKYPNAFMASCPKADFWPVVIYCIMQNLHNKRPEHVTGPSILWMAVNIYKNPQSKHAVLEQMKLYMPDMKDIPVQIRPRCELYPIDWFSKTYLVTPCSYAITYWTGSWKESCNLGFEKNL